MLTKEVGWFFLIVLKIYEQNITHKIVLLDHNNALCFYLALKTTRV